MSGKAFEEDQDKEGKGMIPCPYCGHGMSSITDTRPNKKESWIRRRRQCDNCGQRFTTIEILVSRFRKLRKLSLSAEAAMKRFASAVHDFSKETRDD